MSDLDALIERVEAATGPCSALERDLWEAVTGECVHREVERIEFDDDSYSELQCKACGADTYGKDPWSGITRSLDASLALVERKLPGWMVVNLSEWENERMRARGRWMAQLKPIGAQGDLRVMSAYCQHAPTPALALISALLRALKSAEGKETP